MTIKADELPPLRSPGSDTAEEIYQKYRPMLDEDMPEQEARNLIESVWTVMYAFAELGWGQDSASLAIQERELKKKLASKE